MYCTSHGNPTSLLQSFTLSSIFLERESGILPGWLLSCTEMPLAVLCPSARYLTA